MYAALQKFINRIHILTQHPALAFAIIFREKGTDCGIHLHLPLHISLLRYRTGRHINKTCRIILYGKDIITLFSINRT